MQGGIDQQGLLESAFGEKSIPLLKTPGFAILADLLSSNKGQLYSILENVLSENNGSNGISTYGDEVNLSSLATSLFRDTPPTLDTAKDGSIYKAKREVNQIDEKTCKESLSKVRQSMIPGLQPLLQLSFHDGRSKIVGGLSENAGLWRELSVLLSLRIFCAACAREEPFMQSLKDANIPLEVIPSLSFVGPIHGSYSHRFREKKTVIVSRLGQQLTKSMSSSSPDIMPVVSDYVGYCAGSLPRNQSIAKSSFGLISYITHSMPIADASHALVGNDINGVRLAYSFSRGLAMPNSGFEQDVDLRDSILQMILSSIQIDSSNLNLSLILLGLTGSRHNCFSIVLDCVNDTSFVLDPRTSELAAKCFEIIYRVCDLGSHNRTPEVLAQRLRMMDRLRQENFWQRQIVLYLSSRNTVPTSILSEISASYTLEHGDDMDTSHRDNGVLHSMSWLFKSLSIEFRSLIDRHDNRSIMSLKSMLALLLDQPNSMLLKALKDLPLGHTSNAFITEKLQTESLPRDLLKKVSAPMEGSRDIVSGYEVIDVPVLLELCRSHPPEVIGEAAAWAVAWNSLVQRVCACSHLSSALSDVVRTALICLPVINRDEEHGADNAVNARSVMEMLSALLLRLLSPRVASGLGQFGILPGSNVAAEAVEAECAMPLGVAALDLTSILFDLDKLEEDPTYDLDEEVVGRILVLIMGGIASCADSRAGLSSNDGRAAVLSCALTQVLTYAERTNLCLMTEDFPSRILEVFADAVFALFGLATAPVPSSEDSFTPHETKRGAIALAARSGLVSLLGYIMTCGTVGQMFFSRVFTHEPLTRDVEQLVHLIKFGDQDVSRLLQQIALFDSGVEVLKRLGVMAMLLEFADSYVLQEQRYLASHLGKSANQLKPPAALLGHISLVCGMLSSPLTVEVHASLANDALNLLRLYSKTIERLFQTYPSGEQELVTKCLECLCLTYSGLRGAAGLGVTENTLFEADDSLTSLETSVLRLACQLSAHPFPSSLLAPLPYSLIQVEKLAASQMKNVTVSSGQEHTWWDNVSASDSSDLPLPCPPTGSIDASSHQSLSRFGKQSNWSIGKYQMAITASKCLELCVQFLISRTFFYEKRHMVSFSVDAVAIAKGICRCCDASKVSLQNMSLWP